MATSDDIKVALDNLTNEVKGITDEVDAAIAAFNGIANQMTQLAGDPEAIQALASQLKDKAAALANAIPAGT